MSGLIFDFNGTMVQDSEYHAQAWVQYAERYLGITVTHEYYYKEIHGHANDYITGLLLNRTPTAEETASVGDTKEELYRQLCRDAGDAFCLTEGLAEFLDLATQKGIPMAIASSAIRANMEFYFERFSLSKWFDRDLVIYDDGTFKNKPSPDIYLKAIGLLGTAPTDVTVFEDSDSGIESAAKAGVTKIIRISNDTVPVCDPRVYRTVRNFTEITL